MAKSLSKRLSKHKSSVGKWAFLIGVIIAVVIGLFSGSIPVATASALTVVLVVIGLVVGLLNVTEEEAMPFLLSGAVLIIAGGFGQSGSLMNLVWIGGILDALLAIFVPATIIVAIKNVFAIAKS